MKFRYVLAGSLLLIALCVVPPVLAQEIVGGRAPTADPATAAATAEYWTTTRMRNALPFPMPSGTGPTGDRTSLATELNQADGEPGRSSGGRPGRSGSVSMDDSDSSALAPADEDDTMHGAGPHGYHMPFPFTMYEVNPRDIQQYPYSTIGRIFFTTASGFNSSCSGSSIGGRAVLTAGHCVSDGAGRRHSNWIFRPAYRDAGVITSIGTWTTAEWWTYTAWFNSGSFCRDVGFLITNNLSGLRLSQRVGWLGHAWNWDAQHQHWSQFGYPAERSKTSPEYFFNGRRMFENQASFAEFTAAWWNQSCSPLPYCFGSYMTGGASGGPEIWKFDPTGGIYPGGGNYANGVTSTYYLSNRVAGGICSPYFDTSVRDFIVQMQGR